MANFTYKKTKTTSMKIAGLLDTDRMLVDVNGDEKGFPPSSPLLMAGI